MTKNYYQSWKVFYIILIFKKTTSVHSFMIMCIPNHSPPWKVISWEQRLCPIFNVIIIVMCYMLRLEWLVALESPEAFLEQPCPPRTCLPRRVFSPFQNSNVFYFVSWLIVSSLEYEGQKLSLIILLHPVAGTGPWTW